ncbi:MAG: insulinase family protein, partial [Syntrophothermus sp.]
FLNAMTGSDMTIYPVASMNDKDYFNLMHIYLDAVFNPLIYKDPRIFYQEGWHYEMDDSTGKLNYKGVVYNEMKGAYSSPTRELGYQIQKNLFPDNCYRFSSGGYPSKIPALTYEDFLSFHKKYYHPANSYIFLYGNANLDKELEFIDKNYLSKYEKSGINTNIPLQKPFAEMKKIGGYYPATEGDNTEKQTYLTLNFVAGLNTDRKLAMALNILSDVLINQEAAPVRLALQEAGIGQDVNASFDDIQQNVFQIIVQNAEAKQRDKFLEIVMAKLKDAVKSGLDKRAVEGALNRIEFRLREGDDAQKGLTYNFQAITGWFFANDPFIGLEYEKPLQLLKEGIGKGYLEEVIQKYFIDNPHSLLLVLEPKPGLEKENNAAIEEELKAYRNKITKKEIEELGTQTKALIEYQNKEDSPEALETIPMLERKDINPKSEWYAVEKAEVKETPLLYHEEFTNDVIYARFMFDLRTLPQELIPYAELLSEVLGSQNTDNYSYGELDKELNIKTGGFYTYLSTFLADRDDNKMMPEFVVDAKFMNNKTADMFSLFTEIINHTKYSDISRLKEIMVRLQSRLESRVKQNGMGYSQIRLSSYYSKSGMFNEMTNGLEFYWFISKLLKDFDSRQTEISDNLKKTAALLFSGKNLIASVTCSKNDYQAYTGALGKALETLPSEKKEIKNWDLTPSKRNEGIQTASKVQYVIAGYDFKKLGYSWSGKMKVLEQILSTDYLQTKIRVIGGAYGGFCSFSSAGPVVFSSYRDPNLKETLDNYYGAPEYLDKLTADEKSMTRYIIGTIAGMDSPLTPSEKGTIAVRRYLENITPEMVQKERDEVLSTTIEDVKSLKKMVNDILGQKSYCVYGNEDKVKSEQALFNSLIKLNQ